MNEDNLRFPVLVLGLAVALILILFVPKIREARRQGQLNRCKSNLKNLATALEMYSTDNLGHYPPSMNYLTPNYLKEIPACPASRHDSYSASYQHGIIPDCYTIGCRGGYHRLPP